MREIPPSFKKNYDLAAVNAHLEKTKAVVVDDILYLQLPMGEDVYAALVQEGAIGLQAKGGHRTDTSQRIEREIQAGYRVNTSVIRIKFPAVEMVERAAVGDLKAFLQERELQAPSGPAKAR